MYRPILAVLFTGVCVTTVTVSSAQFVDDEFNAGALGPQWTFIDSNPAGSTSTLTGTHYSLTAKEGSDFFMTADAQASLQQNAPSGTNWEVVTKLDNFDPTAPTFGRSYNKTGIQLWQDNDHWLSIYVMSNGSGTERLVEAIWQTDPVPGRFMGDFCGITAYAPVTTSPLYLKVQKTTKGYFAMMSGDGIAWTSVLPMVRNPETTDGYFTGEKIRLIGTGGFGAGNSRPAEFDYIRSAAVTGLPSAPSTSDEFNAASLDSAVWGSFEGIHRGTTTVSGGNLSMTSGYYQDQWVQVQNAMHVYQDAPISNTYSVGIKGSPLDMRPHEQWNAYGIMLWQDQCNWVMIGNQRKEDVTNRLEVAYKRNGLYDVANVDFGTGALPAYLQIEKNGTKYTARYSFDTVTWNEAPPGGYVFGAALRNAQVRLYSKRVFGPGATELGSAATARFDWYHVTGASTAAQDWQLY